VLPQAPGRWPGCRPPQPLAQLAGASGCSIRAEELQQRPDQLVGSPGILPERAAAGAGVDSAPDSSLVSALDSPWATAGGCAPLTGRGKPSTRRRRWLPGKGKRRLALMPPAKAPSPGSLPRSRASCSPGPAAGGPGVHHHPGPARTDQGDRFAVGRPAPGPAVRSRLLRSRVGEGSGPGVIRGSGGVAGRASRTEPRGALSGLAAGPRGRPWKAGCGQGQGRALPGPEAGAAAPQGIGRGAQAGAGGAPGPVSGQ
jgi:hypothetical protein